MKKNLLALTLSCVAGTALAADYDDRWMLTPSLTYTDPDSAKNLDSDIGFGLAFGHFMSEDWSFDLELNTASLDLENGNGSIRQNSFNMMSRYHFNDFNSLRPFIGFGGGILDNQGSGAADSVSSFGPMLNVSAGLRKTMSDRFGFITEVKYRLDFDDYADIESNYGDFVFSLGMNVYLGEKATATPAAQIVEPAPQLDSDGDGVSDLNDRCPNTPAGMRVDQYGCHDGDDDNDGVKNSNDKCPNTRAGATVDADGCEVQVVIELQGVNFNFDKATLKPESIEILDAAVNTMGKHGTIAVEIAGHTDAVGTNEYNQDLSERRAKVVYNYLVDQGVSADRMTWKGYGESSPIATNETDEGRAKNRRTELVVED